MIARGCDPKEYRTPYGVMQVERDVYQTSHGGRIYCQRLARAADARGDRREQEGLTATTVSAGDQCVEASV